MEFTTRRLRVAPVGQATAAEAEAHQVLSPEVTAFLPPDLRVSADGDAASWLARAGRGGQVLQVRDAAGLAGFLLLFDAGGGEWRLGYLFARSVWGRGYASELVRGLVARCGSDNRVRRLVGGVDLANTASARVLQKAGFTPAAADGPGVYALEFRR